VSKPPDPGRARLPTRTGPATGARLIAGADPTIDELLRLLAERDALTVARDAGPDVVGRRMTESSRRRGRRWR
jgi:hypothetical protein